MTRKKNKKYERYQLASIPLLLGVLAYVLYGAASADDEPAPTPPAQLPVAAATAQAENVNPITRATVPWPEVDLQFVAQANPFVSGSKPNDSGTDQYERSDEGAVSTKPSADPLDTIARDLASTQVDYLFESERRKLVMLGGQVFEQGDLITDSVQLKDIENGSLILTRKTLGPSGAGNARAID